LTPKGEKMGVENVKSRKPQRYYSEGFKVKVLKDYIESGMSRKDAAKKYNLHDASILSHWVRKFGIDKSAIVGANIILKPMRIEKSERELELEHHVKELEKRLEEKEREVTIERLRTHALDTLIDVAEEQLHIQIRKKAGAKR
jgi:transposase-like protein